MSVSGEYDSCDGCGEMKLSESMEYCDGKKYCEECDDKMVVCYSCGSINVLVGDREDADCCDDCGYSFDDRECVVCLVKTRVIVTDDGEEVCEKHAGVCKECEEFKGVEYYSEFGEYYCQKCVDDNFYECEGCNKYVMVDDYRYSSLLGGLCESCEEDAIEGDGLKRCDDCGELFDDSEKMEEFKGKNEYDGKVYEWNEFVCECCMGYRKKEGDSDE